MSGKSAKNTLTLVGLDIEGQWNIPLLQNAAEISGVFLELIQSKSYPTGTAESDCRIIDDLKSRYDCVLACETARKSRNIYQFPAPRGDVALIVGNELRGIPDEMLREVDQVLSIPLLGRTMTSVNVGAAAATALYVLQRDLARRRSSGSRLRHRDIDVLLYGASDPYELGSVLRSAWAFGWKKVYVCDTEGIWFTDNREIVMAGRAAARREVNPLVIAPYEQLSIGDYDKVIVCTGERTGTPLSRLKLPDRGRVLIVCGWENHDLPGDIAADHVFVDHQNSKAQAVFRHMSSILLSVVSDTLLRGSHG